MITHRQAQYLFLAIALTAFVAYVVPFQLLVPVDADRGGEALNNRSTTGQANCKSKNTC